VDQKIYEDSGEHQQSSSEVLERYMEYMQQQLQQGVYLKHMSRHLLGLFAGQPGAKAWRRYISENAYKPDAGIEVIKKAASLIN